MAKAAIDSSASSTLRTGENRRVDLVLESLCGEGCKAVWGVIASLESGEALPQTDGLSDDELDELLAELKSVMAVYAGTCGA